MSKQPIVGYHEDELGDWVAELRCGHGQHVRHDPPWQSRPWVLTHEGRTSQLGAELNCVICDSLPLGSPPTSMDDRQEILDALQDELGLKIPEQVLHSVWTVRDFEAVAIALTSAQQPDTLSALGENGVRQKVREAISDQMALPIERIVPEARLFRDLGMKG